MAMIEGYKVKELICKNDDCMQLLGYAKIDAGIIIHICRKCKTTSVWKINYSQKREEFDKLVNMVERGGE